MPPRISTAWYALLRSHVPRILPTIIAAAALYEAFAGLFDLDTIVSETRSPSFWTVAYGPPLWILGVVVALMALFSLTLTWKVAPTKASRLLALFAALISCGYGFVFYTTAFRGFEDSAVGLIRDMRSHQWSPEIVRMIGRALFALPNLAWIPSWLFAGAVFLRFVQMFPSAGESLVRTESGLQPAVLTTALACWIYTANLLPQLGVLAVCGVILGAGAISSLWWDRPIRRSERVASRTRTSLDTWMVAVLAIGALLQVVPRLHVTGASAFLLLACAGLVVGLPRAQRSRPAFAYLVPSLVTVVFLFGPDPDISVDFGLMPWLFVCLVLGVRTIGVRLPELAPRTHAQVMWLLSGCFLACLLAVAWGVAAMLGVSFACGPTDTTAVCLLYRYQDWFLVLPLPTLVVFFSIALFYRGDIDATALFQRTTLYGLMAFAMVFLFGIIDYEITKLVGGYFPAWVSAGTAAGSLAVVVHPVKKLLETRTDWLIRTLLRL